MCFYFTEQLGRLVLCLILPHANPQEDPVRSQLRKTLIRSQLKKILIRSQFKKTLTRSQLRKTLFRSQLRKNLFRLQAFLFKGNILTLSFFFVKISSFL